MCDPFKNSWKAHSFKSLIILNFFYLFKRSPQDLLFTCWFPHGKTGPVQQEAVIVSESYCLLSAYQFGKLKWNGYRLLKISLSDWEQAACLSEREALKHSDHHPKISVSVLRQHALRQLLKTQFTFFDRLLFFNDSHTFFIAYYIEHVMLIKDFKFSWSNYTNCMSKFSHLWNTLRGLAHAVVFISEAVLNHNDDDDYTLDDTWWQL